MDAFTFSANMNETTSTLSDASTNAAASSSKVTGNVIRANYSLSKRTTLYAAQGRDSYSVVDGNKTVTTSFGLMHSF
jgi:predicted porin